MQRHSALHPAALVIALLGCVLSGASLAQSVFLFQDEKLPDANASDHIIGYDMGANYANPRLKIDRSAQSKRKTPPQWDAASAGGVLAGLNPKILLNASGTSDSQPQGKPKVGLAVTLQANAVSDRNNLLPEDRVKGQTKALSELRKGWVIKEYRAFPNQPTRLEGVDLTFALRSLSQSAMGTELRAGVWISAEGSSQVQNLMDVDCNYLMCRFTQYDIRGVVVRQDVQFGQNIIHKAFLPQYKPGTTFWWMCQGGGSSGDLATHAKDCRARAVAEESLEATKARGPWQKQGKLDYTVEADMTRFSRGMW